MLKLNNIGAPKGANRDKKRRGRGPGSGLGKTGGRGHKGQKARSGGGIPPWFEGGQMPLQKRLPKYGFTSRIGRQTASIRLSALAKVQGDTVDLETLLRKFLHQYIWSGSTGERFSEKIVRNQFFKGD